MVLSDDQEHPYLYGRVLDFFHVVATNNGPGTLLEDNSSATLQMVWVRWFKLDIPVGPSGFHSLRYPLVSFGESTDPEAFALVHPEEILRAVHLIPAFTSGHTAEYLAGPTKGHPESEQDDWMHYNINMWVEAFQPLSNTRLYI